MMFTYNNYVNISKLNKHSIVHYIFLFRKLIFGANRGRNCMAILQRANILF